jgi:hypothetical protein
MLVFSCSQIAPGQAVLGNRSAWGSISVPTSRTPPASKCGALPKRTLAFSDVYKKFTETAQS